MAEQNKWRRRLKVLGFVLVAFGLWLVFATLTETVITCVPGGQPCVWDNQAPSGPPPPSGGMNAREWADILIGLAAALWAAGRIFFPPEDFTPPAPQGNAR